MSPVVRFAPSPTGRIHIGNARTAILNWLFARKHGGSFMLRYDDTDRERSTDEFARGIAEDLAWLGIAPDRVERQSRRFDRYAEITERLKEVGRLYPAYETPDELERRRRRQLARHEPPVYDRAALNFRAEDRARLEVEGRKPHWRFKLDRRTVEWSDLIRGPQHIDTGSLSDPILVRGDGTWLYTFTSVVDDIDFGITHVIRGEDHVVNTAVQIEIFEALGARPPQFAHHSLLTGADGRGLSKRLGSLSVSGLREQGLEAMAVASHAALVGTSESIHPCTDFKELIESFDLAKLSRAPARFDEAELKHLNARLLHMLPWSAVKDRLGHGSEAFWLAIRGNIEKLSDSDVWWKLIRNGFKPPAASADDRALLATAARFLPPEPWNGETWRTWSEAVKEATGRRGKALFMPLRLALTGLDHGPELAALLPLLGRQKVLDRLS
jgi:glutamyl-tRNA synthetase